MKIDVLKVIDLVRSLARQFRFGTCSGILLVSMSTLLRAEVKIPAILSSHMVLQREQPIHLWGWANPQENVSVEFNATRQSAAADRLGHWDIFLPPQSAGGPYTLTIKAANTIQLEDVLVGDVWFASGQSNMEMPLSGFPNSAVVTNADEEIRNANQPNIRLLFIHHKASDFPLHDFEATSWTKCTAETAAKFSAVAYFFGKQLVDREHVPIGLIDSTWGGTPGEAWISMHGLSADSSLMPVFSAWASFSDEQTDLQRLIEAEKQEDEAARRANQPLPKHDWHPEAASWQPAALFNGMVAPAVDFHIKGVIWYQGESNASSERANLYEKVLPALIADWRTDWHQGNFPFLFVQIANFKSGSQQTWPVVREAQRRTLAVANTGMAVTIDIGDPDNVHPSNKQDVGARLALAARRLAYGEDVEDAGPLYREIAVEGHSLRVWFDHASGGLVAKGGTLKGFEIAGDDRHFVKADARIEGESVVVSCEGVANPKFVHYGWANAPTVNLTNGKGLPASPFTSEDQIPRP
jgi:sialate O-acetylesterase